MKNTQYHSFCEQLFQNWKKDNIPEKEKLEKVFQMDYVPEPYLYFNPENNPLYVLYNNPGGGIDEIQKKEVISEKNYYDFAKRISEYYLDENKFKYATAAYNRIKKAMNFAKHEEYSGIINIETLPFHSSKLNKPKAIRLINKVNLLQDYIEQLKLFLADKPALALSGCNSRVSITEETIEKSDWISLQAELIGFDINHCNRTILKEKGDKVTSAIFKNNNKYILLMAGSNNFPASFKTEISKELIF